MELFVINRHGDESSGVTEEEERHKLGTILKRIEHKKKKRSVEKIEEAPTENGSNESTEIKTQPDVVKRQKLENEAEPVLEAKDNEPVSKTIDPKAIEGFTILGADSIKRKSSAKRVLPHWLAHPTTISSNLQDLHMKVSKMKQLDKALRRQLKANGIDYFFPVQAHVIPSLLQMHQHADIMVPSDICVSAPTGSGKTLAFILPIIQALMRHSVRKVRALVILPTQDLAEQVFSTFKMYSRGTNIEVGLITGKKLFDVEQKQLVHEIEAFGYVSKIDILVCTPGRLVTHMKQTKGFNLRSLEFLVIDEADRVLENVQDDWLYHLQKHSSGEDFTVQSKKILNLFSLEKQKTPQKLLFSATLTRDPEKLEKLSLFQPKLFTSVTSAEIEGKFSRKYITPDELTEKYLVCSKELKPLVLYDFIKRENLTRTIVFTHSVETATRLKILLQSLFQSNIKVEAISSKLKGARRVRMIEGFTRGDFDVLISTDALARGIDLPKVECVVSYSAPKYIKTYIHRVGRTARAGAPGLAVTLLHHEQLKIFDSLIKNLNKTLEEVECDEDDLQDLSELYKNSLKELKEIIEEEEKSGLRSIIREKKSVRIEKKQKSKRRVFKSGGKKA